MLHLRVHPDNPQARLISQAVERIRAGDVVVYPTDAAYAIGCQIGNKHAMERIAQIRGLGPKHQYAIICCDLSDLATYAKVDNAVYRLLKNNTPAVTTFILPATSEVPKRLMHPKKNHWFAYPYQSCVSDAASRAGRTAAHFNAHPARPDGSFR